jgi:hypothetical protein
MSAHVNCTRRPVALGREPHSLDALYRRALDRGLRGQARAMLGGRPRCLLGLESVQAGGHAVSRRDAGLQAVPIDCISGSEGRACDFDSEFNPLRDSTRDRWLGIASAMQRGRVLPPVILIQVGDRYFVRDGHHRISVARALGRETIEARVEVWRAEERQPCEQAAHKISRSQARSPERAHTHAGGSRPASILAWLLGRMRSAGREAAG